MDIRRRDAIISLFGVGGLPFLLSTVEAEEKPTGWTEKLHPASCLAYYLLLGYVNKLKDYNLSKREIAAYLRSVECGGERKFGKENRVGVYSFIEYGPINTLGNVDHLGCSIDVLVNEDKVDNTTIEAHRLGQKVQEIIRFWANNYEEYLLTEEEYDLIDKRLEAYYG